ncbi:MAG: DUF4825 domain-containing protein [Lachnospiraceae bacterium]|nr:DUF4825 domain-containing protein [Lachnospiraceae bacterium]
MNKIPCELIKDLFPSYIDGLTADKTNSLIEEHLVGCEDCSRALKAMRGETEQELKPDEDDRKEIAFLKKTKRMQNIAFFSSIAAIVLCALTILLRFFIVGTSHDGAFYIEDIRVEDGTLYVKPGTTDSMNVISRMKFTEAEGVVTIQANEVPVSVFASPGKEFSYALKQPEELKEIRLGSRILWEGGSRISPLAAAVYASRHAYVGDMSANRKTADALGVTSILGDYSNQLETSAEPYGWILELKEDIPADREAYAKSKMESVAYVLIAMTGNLDHVSFTYTVEGKAGSISFDAADAGAFLGGDIKECSHSARILDELISKAGF